MNSLAGLGLPFKPDGHDVHAAPDTRFPLRGVVRHKDGRS